MVKNYLLFVYNETLRKYQLYSGRLQKKIKNGSFKLLSAARKNFLLSKIEALRLKLANLKPQLASFATAGILAATLGANSATAQTYTEVTGPSNPFAIVSAPGSKSPNSTFADLDNDGDKDLLVADYDNLLYYKNTGTKTAALYSLQTGTTNNPFSTLVGGISGYTTYLAPTLGDMDGDGDFDLIIGTDNNYGVLHYFKNTGTKLKATYTYKTGTTSILPTLNGGSTDELVPYIIDIDNDGDNDLFIGEEDGTKVFFVKNIGTKLVPNYVQQTGTLNPFDSFAGSASGGYRAQPAFADCDGDGDIDAIVGSSGGGSVYYRNTGTTTAPIFVPQTGTNNNPFDGISTFGYFVPSFVDIDNDGDQDLALGDNNEIRYFKSSIIVLSTDLEDISTKVNLYPTMTSGDIKIDVPSELIGKIDVTITNSTGQVVYNAPVSINGTTINLSGVLQNAENGMYVVSLKNDVKTSTSKVIKY